MNNRLKILSAAAIAIFTSCGGNKGAESMEKGESAMAVVEAAMMEGRNAARIPVARSNRHHGYGTETAQCPGHTEPLCK